MNLPYRQVAVQSGRRQFKNWASAEGTFAPRFFVFLVHRASPRLWLRSVSWTCRGERHENEAAATSAWGRKKAPEPAAGAAARARDGV